MRIRSRPAKFAFWALLLLPALHIVWRYRADTMSYGEVIHETGDWSIGLLVVALAITPLSRVASTTGWWVFLRFHRRAIGVASFAYAALHTATYLDRKWGADLILVEGAKPGLATGWIALAIYSALAATSNNESVRRLGPSWKVLHRSVYAATGLVFAHWILTAIQPQAAYAVILVIAAFECLRWLPARRKRRS